MAGRPQGPLVVGLTVAPSRLAAVRTARMKQLRMEGNTEYADVDALREEVTEARRLCAQRDSPVIDATYRSNGGVIIDLLRSGGNQP